MHEMWDAKNNLHRNFLDGAKICIGMTGLFHPVIFQFLFLNKGFYSF